MAEISVFTSAQQKGEMPTSPYVRIWLANHSSDTSERILLSPQLKNEAEIDEAVDKLIKQLENVRKKAKQELIRKKEQRHESLQE